MAKVRLLSIKNFRAINELAWEPCPGINCLIGPGDSGKTTILDAIDLCLGARRNPEFNDSDFHNLDIANPIVIQVTIGELNDELKNLDNYGLCLRGYDEVFGGISDEPDAGLETVLTIQMQINEDLEPAWTLFSERSVSEGRIRILSWSDRAKIAPARLGTFTEYDLSWRKGSVLSRLTPEKVDISAAMAKIHRSARQALGNESNEQLKDARLIVSETAEQLGIRVGGDVRALLNTESVSLRGGVISLHNATDIPLSNLGVGSSRLLVAGLQKRAGDRATVILIDELEYGLEPHRLIRLLNSLGSKDKDKVLQVFMTTHSPVAVRELNGDQLFVLRRKENSHDVLQVGTEDGIQGTIRLSPDAFLAPSVLICEGATEVGFLRGLDQYRMTKGKRSMAACGVAIVDANGVSNMTMRGTAFQKLKVRSAFLRDDDACPKKSEEKEFINAGGVVFKWSAGKTIEEELFRLLSSEAVGKMLLKAVDFWGSDIIDAHIRSSSLEMVDLDSCLNNFDDGYRAVLAKASISKDRSWFKRIDLMEEIAREVIGPDAGADFELDEMIAGIFEWVESE